MTDVAELPALKLLALDHEDLAVVSANVQDMAVKPGDMAWMPAQHRFALVGERFDWLAAEGGRCERVACGLHFDCVKRVRTQGLDGAGSLNLLSMTFDEGDAPSGVVTLIFSGGATLKLDVECVEAHLRDLGPRHPCGCKPNHPCDERA